MPYGSKIDTDEELVWDPGSDPALTDLAAKSVALRERAGCRTCGASACTYCGVPVQPQPGNVTLQLCHSCFEKAYGATEADPFSGEPLPTVPTCQRRTPARIGA